MKLLKYYTWIHTWHQIIVQLSINAEFSFIKTNKQTNKMFCARLIFVLTGSDENSPPEHQKKEYKFGSIISFLPQLDDKLSDKLTHFVQNLR